MVVVTIERANEELPPLRTAAFKISVEDFKFYKLSDLKIWNETGVLVCDLRDPSLRDVPFFEVALSFALYVEVSPLPGFGEKRTLQKRPWSIRRVYR